MTSRILPLGLLLALAVPAAQGAVKVTFDRATVLSGDSVLGTVTLSDPAPTGGAEVRLDAYDRALRVPAQVTVPAGATTAAFTLYTGLAFKDRNVTVYPSYGSQPRTNGTFLLDGVGATMALNAPSVRGGTSDPLSVTLTFDRDIPVKGKVHIVSRTTAYDWDYYTPIADPDKTVLAGQRTVTIPLEHGMVSVDTVFNVVASEVGEDEGWQAFAFASATETLIGANPKIVLATDKVAPGTAVAATWSLDFPLRYSPWFYVGTYGPGRANSPSFAPPIGATSQALQYQGDDIGNVKCFALGPDRISASATLKVLNPGLTAVSVPAARAQTYFRGKVTIGVPAGPGGIVVNLSSSDNAVVRPEASVTIPEGATQAEFNLVSGDVVVATSAVVTATAGGGSRQATVTVTPVAVKSLTLSAATVVGGNPLAATVTMDAPVGVNTLVTVTSDDPSVVVAPSATTVVKGNASRTFTVTTKKVTAAKFVKITVTKNGKSVYRTLKVTP